MTRSTIAALVLLFAAVSGVSRLQPRLAATMHEVKERDDVYALPPPAQLHASTLGWDAAAVDLLWATLLTDYGTHWHEKRSFTQTPLYADAMLQLEPDYYPIYNFIGTLLAYRPTQGTEDDVRRARAFLERGTRERPADPRVWRELGQFVSFIAPSFLTNPSEVDQWKKDGAAALERSTELGSDPDEGWVAQSLLSRLGEAQAQIDVLRKLFALTADPSQHELHERVRQKLELLEGKALQDEADDVARALEDRRQRDAPYLRHDEHLLVGPRIDSARCAGTRSAADPTCGRSWAALVPSP